MEQQHSPESDQNFARNPTPDLTPFQTLVNPYLDLICLPLARSLSPDEATEQRAEMRTHLESLVAAYVELDLPEAEAVRLSLEQFGRENHLQQHWRQECKKTELASELSAFLPGFRFAMRSFGLAFLLSGLCDGWLRLGATLPGSLSTAWVYWYPMLLAIEVCGAFLAGIRVGRRVRHRPLLVALTAVLPTCLIIPTICPMIYLGEMFVAYHRLQGIPGVHIHWLAFWCDLATPVVSLLPIVGMVGVAFGQFSRRVHHRRIASSR
jgi:hypothetical protein